MSKDATTPVTKTDIDSLEERLFKAIAGAISSSEERIMKAMSSLKTEMDQQFHFVAEKLSDMFNRFDAIEERLDVIEDRLDVLEKRIDDLNPSSVLNHEERLRRLERFAKFAA